MREILHAVINENRELVISPSEGFAGEHNAEIIEIDIGPFAAEEYEYYILNFEVFGAKGKLISNIIRTGDDEPSYIDNGMIYCPLTSQLTASGRLRIQLEAHKNTENGEIVKKSSVAELAFKPSVMGAEDMIDSGSSVYGRLENVEERIDGIDAENYGGKISSARAEISAVDKKVDAVSGRVSALENRADASENSVERVHSRLDAIYGYEIPENFSDFEKRIKTLEEKPDGLKEIPVATETITGGIKLGTTEPFHLNENGELEIRYSLLNNHKLAAILVLAFLNNPGVFETFSAEKAEDVASLVYDCSINVNLNIISGFAFSVLERGTVEYVNENFETVSIQADVGAVYVMRKENDVLKVERYFGSELKNLLLEGI